MKRKIIIIIILLSYSLFSQKKAGILVGINNPSSSDEILGKFNFTNEISYHFGAFYEFSINSNITFRPKLLFSQQGNRTTKDFEHSYHKMDYLNIPLNLKFFQNTYIIAGPQIGFLLKYEDNTFNYTDPHSFDVGINLGIGKKIKDFLLELNFYQGIKPSVNRKRSGYNIVKGYNTLVQLSFGYYLF